MQEKQILIDYLSQSGFSKESAASIRKNLQTSNFQQF